jgi:indole-3-glycerol phosphate synthase
MSDILKEICDHKRQEVESRKKLKTLDQLISEANAISSSNTDRKNIFQKAISDKRSANKTAIISEIKRKSPSKGLIREEFDHIEIAKSYQKAGATCISVLTDQKYFGGQDKFLKEAREVVGIPLLRKDFMIDEYQIYESKIIGADCILLIMACLSLKQSLKLESIAHELGMDVLLEVHDEAELNQALKLNSKLLGVNNRNLKTMEISLDNSRNLIKKIPSEYVKICESGIYSRSDIEEMEKIGFDGFLIGESLMKSDDLESSLRSMLG